jgi:DNA-directed RNA polymerase specialized sigma24 family protein
VSPHPDEPPDLAADAVADAAPLVDHEGTVRGEASPARQPSEREPGRMESGPDDAALVARALAGDQQAFDELRAAAERAVRGTVRMQVGRFEENGTFFVDHALVDDLVQTAWVQIWQKLDTYDPSVGRFIHFARYWARIMVRRYRDTPAGRGVETPLSAVLSGGADAEADDSDADRLDRMARRGGAIEPPEDPVGADVYDELLSLTFATNSPPHQLIAFGFAKAAEWRPRQIAAELSNVPLRTLETRLERSYLERSDLEDARVLPAFEPLRNRLEQRFDEAVRDPTTLATYPGLHARIVGETTLADYYTGEPTADVTQWWYAVKRRVLAEVQRRDSGPLADLLRQAQRQSAGRGAARRTTGRGAAP